MFFFEILSINRNRNFLNFLVLVFLVNVSLLILPSGISASDLTMADKVIIEKEKRRLHLLNNKKIIKSFSVALGLSPLGHKRHEGDSKTPEGSYFLDGRNQNSDFFLSIHVSYPNSTDIQAAKNNGLSPGGEIMIHGQPNNPIYPDVYYETKDWTNGCIAVSNGDMMDIWMTIPDMRIPIDILP